MSQEFTTYRSVFDKSEYIKQGYIITYDDLNSVDDLPELSTLERQDIYHARTGDLSSDYIVPVDTDESGSFDAWYSLVDGEEVFAIPDSGLKHHYIISESATTSQVDDLEGDLNLTGSLSSIEEDEFDGHDAARFNGVDDLIDGSRSSESPPYEAFYVARFRDTEGRVYAFDFSDSDRTAALTISDPEDEWELVDADVTGLNSGIDADTDWHLFNVQIDPENGDNGILRLDDSVILETGFDTGDWNGITIGGRSDDDSGYAEIDWTEGLYYDPSDENYDRTDVVDYIKNRYPSLQID